MRDQGPQNLLTFFSQHIPEQAHGRVMDCLLGQINHSSVERVCWRISKRDTSVAIYFSCRFLGIGSVGGIERSKLSKLRSFSCRFLGIGSVGRHTRQHQPLVLSFSCRFLGIGSVGAQMETFNPHAAPFQLQVPWDRICWVGMRGDSYCNILCFSCRFLGIGSVGRIYAPLQARQTCFSCRFLGIGSVGQHPVDTLIPTVVSVAGSLG